MQRSHKYERERMGEWRKGGGPFFSKILRKRFEEEVGG